MKKLILSFLAIMALSLGAATVLAQAEAKEKKKKKADSGQAGNTAPKSVIHVVTVKFKDDAKPEQIQAALDGVKAMPAKYPGMTRVWTKTHKIQNQKGAEKKVTHVFAMEFESMEAFEKYTDSPAQLEWYKTYLPIRETSTTHDVTN